MTKEINNKHLTSYLTQCDCKKYLCKEILEEYEKLKALDENVKQTIKDLDDALSKEMAACPEAKIMDDLKKLLESLYKTNQE